MHAGGGLFVFVVIGTPSKLPTVRVSVAISVAVPLLAGDFVLRFVDFLFQLV